MKNINSSDIDNVSVAHLFSDHVQKIVFPKEAVLIQMPQVPPDNFEVDVARNRGYFAYPPQGLLYLAAVLRKFGVKTTVVDLNYHLLQEGQNGLDQLERIYDTYVEAAIISAEGTPFIGISYMFDLTRPAFENICCNIKKRWPNLSLFAGGVAATADPELLLHDELVDFVFVHEGEESLEQFLCYLRGDSDELPTNIYFRAQSGQVFHTNVKCGSRFDYDILPEYSAIPITEYCKAGSLSNYSRMNGVDVPFATIQSRRGCRGHCTFCSVRSFMGKGVRVRSTESVLAEMETLYHDFGIRHFDWLDDDLIFNEKKSIELFEQAAIRFPDMTWAANNGLVASAITVELMETFVKSGCIGFKVGLESGNESTLELIRKPSTLSQFFSFAHIASSFPSIFISVNYILGLPDESFGQLIDTLSVAVRSKLDWNNFYLYQPLKNTSLYKAFGGMGCEDGIHGLGKEGINPRNLNPVRGGRFSSQAEGEMSGYDIFHLDSSKIPNQEELSEIWFTFNCIANFIKLPALTTKSEIRIQNCINWLTVLSDAYPNDAMMSAVLYYLKKRLGNSPKSQIENVRTDAQNKFNNSKYWQYRDKQFGISSYLDDTLPSIPARYSPYI